MFEIDDVVLTRCRAIPFVHFNAVVSLGLKSPGSEGTLDALLAAYEAAGIGRITVMHHPFCRPGALPEWLHARGFEARPGWDRVYQFGGGGFPGPAPDGGEVVLVTAATASAWGGFLDGWYRLLLHALVEHAFSERVGVVVGDVEAPSANHQGPAYDRWAALGFSVGYHRTHFVRG